MPQSLSNTLIHIVFSTKNRIKIIDDEIEENLFAYISKICNEKKCYAIKVGGYLDHVHIFCSLYRPISQSELLRTIKANSSKWAKSQGAKYRNFYWQDGYGVFSVSKSQSGNLIRYIENQKAHHQKKYFKEEYLELLKRNDVAFDPKYIWE